jgi:uncharacterized membrane protein
MNMELQFPGDLSEVALRSRRNVGSAERWVSVTSGTALALYGLGLSRRKPAGIALAAAGAYLMRRGATGHCDIYQAFHLDTSSSAGDTRRALGGGNGIHLEESITINRGISEIYAFWRDLENLPRFMTHLESVEQLTDTLSRWKARGPGGAVVEWSAEIINEIPNRLIAWRSLEHSDVVSAGSVNFDEAGADRGTRIRVRLQYSPPGGKIGGAVAKLLRRDAATEIREDLRRFKQLLEAGEVATTEGQPRGK